MGKISNLCITLENSRAIFNSGDVIDGNVTVEVTEAIKVKGVYLLAHGSANVHWVEGHELHVNDKRKKEIHHYRNHEKYFEEHFTLWGKEAELDNQSNSEEAVLEKGTHNFNFSVALPKKVLPCSFEGRHGHVRYYLKATIDKPWLQFNDTTKRAFTILGEPYDLNSVSNALEPVVAEKRKTFCCLCCKTGPISVKVNTEKNSYCAGEKVRVSVQMENRSRRNMGYTTATLRQFVCFHSPNKTRSVEEDIVTVVGDGVAPGSTAEWTSQNLRIPPIPPSELKHCHIIDIRYDIQFTVHASGPTTSDIAVRLPIIIGNVPLDTKKKPQASRQTSVPPTISITPNEGGDSHVVSPSPPLYVYQESVFGGFCIKDENDAEEVMGDLSFTPLYAMCRTHSMRSSGRSYSRRQSTV